MVAGILTYCVKEILNPLIKKQYDTQYQARHVVGIDTSEIWIARTGIRGAPCMGWKGSELCCKIKRIIG
jgi:hypothetical protein